MGGLRGLASWDWGGRYGVDGKKGGDVGSLGGEVGSIRRFYVAESVRCVWEGIGCGVFLLFGMSAAKRAVVGGFGAGDSGVLLADLMCTFHPLSADDDGLVWYRVGCAKGRILALVYFPLV